MENSIVSPLFQDGDMTQKSKIPRSVLSFNAVMERALDGDGVAA